MSPPDPLPWHARAPADVARELGTDVDRGLDAPEAARRLVEVGPNRIAERRGRSEWRRFLGQFASVLVGTLAAAALISLALGETLDAAAILALLLLNGVLGWAQERGAANALAALRRMAAPTARVVRGATTVVVPASDLVPGDLVVLEAGDRVPADLRLVRSTGLRTVEAALTGESEPSDKDARLPAPPDAPLAERPTMAWQATTVAAGAGAGVVVATGATTQLGRIAALVEATEEEPTPLEVRLAVLGRWLVLGAAGVVALVFALGVLRGEPATGMFLSMVSLAVAAVPEGLPAVVTIALALGVAQMARRGALVRRLAAVETLGCTSVICTDKTGTLTVGQMSLRALVTADGELGVEGDGYDGPGRVTADGREVTLGPDHVARDLLHAAVGASTARLLAREGTVVVAGDPTEGALLAAAARHGIGAEALEAREPTLALLPFDAARKRMSVVRARPEGERAYVKGAPESVLPRCRALLGRAGERPLDAADRARFEAWNAAQAGQARRVLAVARRDGARGTFGGHGGAADPESDLVLLGLAALRDPPRPAVRAAVAACRSAGIRTVMITGDQAATALAVARELGIASEPEEVATGAEVEAMDEAALAAAAPRLAVYARANPEHKLRIVRAWQAAGHVVAMTGDGVNDAPALKGADIGIAMGRSGTDVAKDAAAMVVSDDDFATIVAAVEAGRAIFDNVRKSLLYLLSGNLAEILVMAAAVLAGMPLPLLPIQLLWINLLTDGLPALALATDPADVDLLRRPPRRTGEGIADRRFLVEMLGTGLLAALVTFAAYLHGLQVGGSLEVARTYAFTTLVFEEVLRSFVVRSRTRIVWEVGLWSNGRLFLVGLAMIALQAAGHHVPALMSFLGTAPLPWATTAVLLALAAVPATAVELSKLARRARRLRPA